MTDTIERQPVRVARDVAAKVGEGSSWKPTRRAQRDYAGTRLNANNERVPIKTPVEQPAVPRAPQTLHIVKTHVWTDGSVWETCTATGCSFGTGEGRSTNLTKRHSDGRKSGDDDTYAVELDEALTEAEVTSEDTIQELDLSPPLVPMLEDVESELDETVEGEDAGEEAS